MAKIIYLSWNPYLKLLYMSWNYCAKIFQFYIKTYARGTFWNLHIKIDLKINISDTNGPIDLKFFMLPISKIYNILLLFLRLFTLPQARTYPSPRTYNPNARGTDACRGSRTLDIYTRAGLTERGQPETTQDRTQTKDTYPIPRQIFKFLTPPGIEAGPTGWKAGTLPTTPRRRINIFFIELKY